MSQRAAWRTGVSNFAGRADYGTLQCRLARADAIAASAELKEKIESAIFKFGWRHGVSTDDARHLLLNTGVRL